jgi:hypothetical protein
MIPSPDAGFVYPKSGLDSDLRFETRPRYVSAGSCFFDGDSGKVTVSAAAGINGLFGSGGTITCWIRPASDGEGNYGRIIDSAGGNGFAIRLQGESSGACELAFSHMWTTTDGDWDTNPDLAVQIGVWNHIAVTYNGTSYTNAPAFYVNGQLVTTAENTGPGSGASINADDGDKIIGNNAGETRTFDGTICNMGLWKGTVLTQAQIRQVMAATTYAAVQAVVQPTAYYLFSADGDDSTGNYDGTLA